MKPLANKKTENYTVIAGCGQLGASLANALSDVGGNVLVIDSNKDSFLNLSTSYRGFTLTGDATDIDVLREAQVEKATAVVVVTNNDNINSMIAQIAREIFKKKWVIARLCDPERDYVYNEFGIDTVCPAVLSVKEIDKLLAGTGKKAIV